MDEVFGDEGKSSIQDMERLAAILKRVGLDAYASNMHDEPKSSSEKMDMITLSA